MAKTMGYQGLLYYGTKGSTAATQITEKVDATYETSVEVGSTTSSGDGSSVPINTGEATALTAKITFNGIVDTTSTMIVAMEAAARTGNPIALRFIRSSGKLGLDADCVIDFKTNSPLRGEQTFEINVVALSNSLRAPLLNA